jgi:hypothetical protein
MKRAVQESKEKGNVGPRWASCGKENGEKREAGLAGHSAREGLQAFQNSYLFPILNSNEF